MGRKDTHIPPRSVSTVNANAPVLQLPVETFEQPMPDISGIDFDVLFQCNSEYENISRVY